MTITNRVSLKSVMAGVTPIPDVPDAPTIGTATAGVGSASVTFTAAATGGTATSYIATSTPGTITGTSATSPITVSGLTNGTAYTFKVKGTNATATGPESSASSSVTPIAPTFLSSAIGYNASPYDIGYGVAVDSSGNTLTTGRTSPNGGYAVTFLLKTDSTGTFTYQNQLKDASPLLANNACIANGISVDSSNNIYVAGSGNNSSYGRICYLNKYDSSGNLTWQRTLTSGRSADTMDDALYQPAVDSSGNVYTVGWYRNISGSNGWYSMVVKYNSSGTRQWVRELRDSSVSSYSGTYHYGLALDSSANVYVVGRGNDSAGEPQGMLHKYNSSGTRQWARKLTDANSSFHNAQLRAVAVDSSGNSYTAGNGQNSSGVNIGYIAKYNTSGTIQWKRNLVMSTYTTATTGIVIDSSGNSYLVGWNTTSSGGREAFIAKYNTSGSIQWQRSIADNQAAGTRRTVAQAVAIDSNGFVVVTGEADYGSDRPVVFILKLNTDGSNTGTYTLSNGLALTVAASSLTDSSSPWTDADGTGTVSEADGTATLSSGTNSFTSEAGSMTYATVAVS